ncbi:hypothetical protein OAB59_03060 [Pelagibacteraceae bacterium]|nr:hypothetical protein [Pelagibacteraceae bacterium]
MFHNLSTKSLGTILGLFFFSILIIDKIISDGIKSSSYLSLEPCRHSWPRGGMVTQRIANPYSNRLFPYKHCIIHHQIVQMLGLGLTIQDFIRVVKIPKDFLVSFIN